MLIELELSLVINYLSTSKHISVVHSKLLKLF